MAKMAGSPGTWSGLSLRVGQFAFAAASVGVMLTAPGCTNYTAFFVLILSMGLQALFSLALAYVDARALVLKRDIQLPERVLLNFVGDLVTSILSFATACSAGGLVILFDRDINFCRKNPLLPCGKFELATALALLSSALSSTSALVMFWLLVVSFLG